MPGLVWPNGSGSMPHVTSEFGLRFHPIDKVWRLHGGIDLVGWSTVCAPFDGQVIYAGYNGGFGNLVKIRRADGVVAYLAHNARFLVGYGAWVTAGQGVAIMGTTGASTGVHCHFEIHPGGGDPINPRDFYASASGGGSNPFPTGDDEMDAAERNAVLSTHSALFYGGGDSGDQSVIQRLVEIQNNLRAIAPRIVNLDQQVTGADSFDTLTGPSVAGRLIAVQQALVTLGAPEIDTTELASALAPVLAPLLGDHLDRLSDDDIVRLAAAAANEADRRERARLDVAIAPDVTPPA